jgi:hypothetical protein
MRALALLAASAGAVVVLGGCGGGAAPGNQAPTPQLPTQGILPRVLLRAGDLGRGYVLLERPDSEGVKGLVTLDLCGHHFASERLRADRIQVDFRSSGPVRVSNEVVRYRPGGAAKALSELKDAASHCPTKAVRSTVPGVGLLRERVHSLTHKGLVPASIALLDTVRRGTADAVTGVLVYQFSGNVLSAIYTNGGSVTEQRHVAFVAADAAARKLAAAH